MFIFSEKDIRNQVGMDDIALSRIEDGFRRLAEGKVTLPPILRVDIPENNGEVDVKTAYIKGLNKFALKISSGFFDNDKLGLPSLSGMMLLFSTETGLPQAVLQDNGYLTDIRTALAGSLSAKYLAKDSLETVGVIGTGVQARYQVQALRLVRNVDHVVVYGRTPEHVERYMSDMKKDGWKVTTAESPEAVLKSSDLVITTTPAKQPIIKKEWLHPGLHITAMGSDAEEKNEIDPAALSAVDVKACDVINQVFRLGEFHHAEEAGLISKKDNILELGTLVTGGKQGRTNNEQITFCDLTGTGVQDTAIAVYAYEQLLRAGKGMKMES